MNQGMKLFGLLVAIAVFQSCVSNKKIASLRQSVQTQQQMVSKLDSTISALNQFRNDKNQMGELDDTSSIAIKKILDIETDSLRLKADSLSQMELKINGKRIKAREYKNMIIIVTNGTSLLSQKMETVDFVDQLLKQQTFAKFNTGAFFPAGDYIIDSSKMGEAKLAFAPIVDSLIAFVQRFPNFVLTSSIVSCGYADGQGFAPGELVTMLTNNLGKTEATKQELNLELSRLRAEQITSVLTEIYKEKIKQFPVGATMDTRFYDTGKGEEYPNKKVKDYQEDDERRRIVIIYWNSLPKAK
jgi:hypothetical protein